uniref:(northern house mosquito) hypothetical protein n=1 Tax=Culex pipiens TaxID=7175 RepID=A0A8D8BJC4_CULPI
MRRHPGRRHRPVQGVRHRRLPDHQAQLLRGTPPPAPLHPVLQKGTIRVGKVPQILREHLPQSGQHNQGADRRLGSPDHPKYVPARATRTTQSQAGQVGRKIDDDREDDNGTSIAHDGLQAGGRSAVDSRAGRKTGDLRARPGPTGETQRSCDYHRRRLGSDVVERKKKTSKETKCHFRCALCVHVEFILTHCIRESWVDRILFGLGDK